MTSTIPLSLYPSRDDTPIPPPPRMPTRVFRDVEFDSAPITAATAPLESGVMSAGWWWG
jgi:hypothetical protein